MNIDCPNCELRLTLDRKLIGKVVSCPKCRQRFQTPANAGTKAISTPKTRNSVTAMTKEIGGLPVWLIVVLGTASLFLICIFSLMVMQTSANNKAKQINELNAKVSSLSSNANSKLESGKIEEARQLANEALSIIGATNHSEASEVLVAADKIEQKSHEFEVRKRNNEKRQQELQRVAELSEASERKRQLEKSKLAAAEAKLQRELTRLNSRESDIRTACWGDSKRVIRLLEEASLTEDDGGALVGKITLDDKEVNVGFQFYKDSLVSVTYHFMFAHSSNSGFFAANPFELDPALRHTLEQKYGEGKTEMFGISYPNINMSSASRTTTWQLPRHTITLYAATSKYVRICSLTYEANTAEAKEYREVTNQRFKNESRERQERLTEQL